MALPPGYLALLEAARACGVAPFSRDDAIRVEDYLKVRGWVIVADWLVDNKLASEVDLVGTPKSITVFTHPSGEDLIQNVLDEMLGDHGPPCLAYKHPSPGEYEVRAVPDILNEVSRRLREITGVRVRW
jgi:hypothetical protein